MDFSNVVNDTFTFVLTVLLAVGFVSLMLYYGLFHFRLARYKNKKLPTISEVPDKDWPSVSVVLVAHNESEFLKESLPYLLEQDYPDFEVVVVDYTSHDDTQFVLRVCSENYPHLKRVNFPEDVNMFKGKKYPLSIGIRSAKKDVILLTEPDCVPQNFNWIREMMCGYMHGASMVMGCSLLKSGKNLLGAMQQYDNLAFNASYLGMAIMGNPYTATGRNLSYRRDFFFNRGGFISHYAIPEGSDDLFVNQNATSSNSTVVISPQSAVKTEAVPTFGLWHLQRMRRIATHRYYSFVQRLKLAVYPLSQALFLASLVLLWVGGLFPWQILLGVLVVKLAWQILSFVLYANKFETKKIQFFAPFFELYFLIADTILALLALSKKKYKWR